ncbi:MAG: hypothetical protein Q7T25_08680 [Sideroxyarcus sp.]|nr:hypothetical protein [Sideroxyarcus sp.]
MNKIFTSTLRLLLVVLIGTFMSPSFAWEMLDSHSEEARLSVMGDADHHDEKIEAHHHHHDSDGGDAAHSQLGHLLSHLPALMHMIELAPVAASTSSRVPTETYSLIQADTAPPFKPPRNFLFV